MSHTNYHGDPYWTRARFWGKCHKCGKTIARGEDIFYYPKGKHVYCDGTCGQVASADFESCAHDEDVYNGVGAAW